MSSWCLRKGKLIMESSELKLSGFFSPKVETGVIFWNGRGPVVRCRWFTSGSGGWGSGNGRDFPTIPPVCTTCAHAATCTKYAHLYHTLPPVLVRDVPVCPNTYEKNMYIWSNLFYFYSIFCPINEIFKTVISAFSLRCKVWNFWVLWCLGCVEDKIRNCCFKKVKKKSTLCSLIELIGLFADNPPGNQSAFEPEALHCSLSSAHCICDCFHFCAL